MVNRRLHTCLAKNSELWKKQVVKGKPEISRRGRLA